MQQEKSESDAKLASAQSDLAEKKQKADSASQALQTAKKDLSSATSTNESLTLPQSYIDYVTGKSTDWDTAKKDLQDVVNNHTYPFTDGDENDTVYDDPAALSESDQKRLDFYVKSLIDSVKSQVGSTSKLTITDGSLEFAKRYTQEYQSSNYVFRKYNAIKSASSIMGLDEYAVTGYDIAANRQVTSRSISIINGYIYNSYEFGTTKMSEIAKAAFDLVTQELANPTDYNNIINNNGYFSVAVTTQDDKFYVCLLTINPNNVPSRFNTNEVVKPSQDELTAAAQKAQADSDQANKDVESAQSTFDQAQAENQKLGQEISDLQKMISNGQSSVASLQKQLTDTAKLQSQIKETKDSLPAKQAALQAANEKVQSTQNKLNDCKTALAAAQKEAANTQSNLDKVKADASSAQQKLQTAQKAYDEAKKKQEKLTSSVASLTKKLAYEKKQLAHAKAVLALAQSKKSTTKKTSTKKTTKKKSTKKSTKKKVAKKVKKTKKVVVASSKFTSLKGSKKAFVGKWKKAKSVSGYQVRYSTASSMKKAKTKSTKATKLKVSGLKNKKKYYVQLRSYRKLSGKTYYSAWTKAKTVKTR
ncbi:SEC10/PgrA surface exclusion domain-containing protein [Lactobacillus delbrueckii]